VASPREKAGKPGWAAHAFLEYLRVVPKNRLVWGARAPGCYDHLPGGTMPKYVIEREVPGAGALSDEQLQEISLRSIQALGELGPKIQWIHSYVTDNKVYCIYLAPDEETICEHARRVGLPADRIAAVRRLLDPINY
jgi:hypothetical protein